MRQSRNTASYAGRGIHGVAVESLARRIVDGTYGEGETLALPELMAELDISQTVLREVIKVLTTKGLLDARQKRGTFVRPREDWNLLDGDVLRWKCAAGASPGFYADLLELRRSVEPAAAALAARRRTEGDLAALDAALGAMSAAGAGSAALHVRAEAAFRTALLAASHNPFYAQLHRIIAPTLARWDHQAGQEGIQSADGAGELRRSPAAHVAVAEAVRAQEADRAYAAMVTLLEGAGPV